MKKLSQTSKLFIILLTFCLGFATLNLVYDKILIPLDKELSRLQKEAEAEYIIYGEIEDIKSYTAAGFLGTSSCLVEVKNKTIALSGYICGNIKEGDTLLKKEKYNHWRTKE